MGRHRGTRRTQSGQRKDGYEAAALSSRRLAAASPEEAASLLERAEVVGYEVVPAGTNYTFCLQLSAEHGERFLAIYKPQRGERPLWDFPHGTLYRRERAAYLTSRQLGWPNIPTTVIREGPFGIGSVQLYVPTRGQWDFSELLRERRDELVRIALFDLLVNNADRKAGHCLPDLDGRVWAIDHGLTFNVAPKLRTVLWDYCGDPIPRKLQNDLDALRDDATRRQSLRIRLEPDLDTAEVDAFFLRLDWILQKRRFPNLDPTRNIPWPLA